MLQIPRPPDVVQDTGFVLGLVISAFRYPALCGGSADLR
jgi:hypothetical protein